MISVLHNVRKLQCRHVLVDKDCKLMRFLALFGTVLLALNAGEQAPASRLWVEFKVKRERLSSAHQEFEVSQTFKTATGSQSSKRQMVLDMSGARWREKSVSGSGNRIRMFDGTDLFSMEEGGDEFVRAAHRSKEEDPAASPYGLIDPDWSKAVELERRPCQIPGIDHQCVLLETPLKRWTRTSAPNNTRRMLEGSARIFIDLDTGLLVFLRTVELIENERSSYQSDVTYLLKRLSYGPSEDASLFKLPSDLREVKELSTWNAAKIKKELAGKPAPELAVTDIRGKPVALSAFKGKTVLLDFWTTWCPPCRADAPALDKLYTKYGGQDLMIVGVSVSEDHALVEEFLKAHPHNFPVVLTTENEMPRPYQIGVFPTYVVIDRDGTVATAVEGDRSFGDLRKLLKKAGLELE
jgi:thiol-disulfide isomerase/thioredoxin